MLDIISHLGNTYPSTGQLLNHWNSCNEKMDNNKCWWEHGQVGVLTHCWWRCETIQLSWKTVFCCCSVTQLYPTLCYCMDCSQASIHFLKCKKVKWLTEDDVQTAEKRREAKGKGEKEGKQCVRKFFKKLNIECLWSSNSTPRYIPKKNESICSHKS